MRFERTPAIIRLPRWLGPVAIVLAFVLTCVALILTPLVLVAMLVTSSIRRLFRVGPIRSTHPRDAASLIACPLCGLCVAAIPESGVCPECGSNYDPHGHDSITDHDQHR